MDSIYWEPEVETLPRKKLEGLQLERLKKTLENVYANVSFYRKRLNDAGIDPVSFNSLDDLEKVPFTLKDDLSDNYPFGMFPVHEASSEDTFFIRYNRKSDCCRIYPGRP